MSICHESLAKDGLERLEMLTAHAQLDTVAQQAAADNWSYTRFLGCLLDGELSERHRKRVALNLQFARFPAIKRMDSFDFEAQPSIDRRLIDELSTGRFLSEGRNVILLGPPGVGKTHLAIALGVMTCELGHRAYFANAIELAAKLSRAVEHNRLHRELNALTQPKLLVLDEIGYLTLDNLQASLLFQVICRRYQKGQSIALTSNKPFSEWGTVFADDPVMASAALDRLLHQSTVINIQGESYRLKEKRKSGTSNLTDFHSSMTKDGDKTKSKKGQKS